MLRKKSKQKIITPRRQRVSSAGSERPAAFSYRSLRSDAVLNTGRQIARSETAATARAASRYWRQRFGLAILLLSAFACLVYVSTLSDTPHIIRLNSPSAAAVLQNNKVYEAAAQRILDSSILNRNKITVSTTGLADRLMAQFPELASVAVSLPILTHRLNITLVSAEPVLILSNSQGSYALDASGTALLTGAKLANLTSLHLPLVVDQSTIKLSLRKQGLTSDNVAFILTVLAQLKANNIAVESLVLPAGTSELDVRLVGQPYFVKFNLASNTSREQAGTLIAVYDRLAADKVTPTQYIDVRVDGRAYYK